MVTKKENKGIRLKNTIRTVVSLLLTFTLIVSTPLLSIPAYAADDSPTITVAYGSTQKVFTWEELTSLTDVGHTIYSRYNTYPTYGINEIDSGVLVTTLLTSAGIDVGSLSANQTITFRESPTGYNATMTIGQLLEDRYFFDGAGNRGGKVPAIIALTGAGNNLPRDYFGQAAASEQTANSFVDKTAYIIIGSDAGSWGTVNINPATGATVNPGDLIRLSVPSGYPPEAKIYYTLNSSEIPTRNSTMYKKINRFLAIKSW